VAETGEEIVFPPGWTGPGGRRIVA
jgi:hypothetical protein